MKASYINKNIAIAELLELAESGYSTLPSIQRPFVWEPERITVFIDSLMRGWPFGTMLFLKQKPNAAKLFPDRAFEMRHDVQNTACEQDSYLVLDGQQRYQSIILAFSAFSKGYEQREKDWRSINCGTQAKTSGNTEVTKYICFNLATYTPGERMITHLDAEDTDDANNRAWLLWKTQQEIEDSLGILVPLSATSVDTRTYPEAAAFLQETLDSIRSLSVPVLEIAAPESSEERAEEQIVEIFTRLNTQGCPLTREQILGAKVKQLWNEFPERLAEMRERLASSPYNMPTLNDDDLVTGFNTLLKAHTQRKDIADAYSCVSGNEWEHLWLVFRNLTENLLQRLIEDCSIRYKQEYQSLHALWFAIALHYRCTAHHNRDWAPELLHVVVKWLMLGNWSKMWANRSGQSVSTLTTLITADLPSDSSTATVLKGWMTSPSLDMKKRSEESVRCLQASARGSVRQYYTYLLVWMRLKEERAKLLSAFKAKYPAWQVDHILPAAWVKNTAHYHELNGLGNCWLLNAEANVIKSDSSFSDFMVEFGIKPQEKLPDRIDAVGICELNQENVKAWNDAITTRLKERETQIMNDLVAYIHNDESAELSYAEPNEQETHQVLLNADDIYRGSEFMQALNGSPKAVHDYLLGVRRATKNLGWNAESGPLPAGSSEQEVTQWLKSQALNDLVNHAGLNNGTYRTGWKKYLQMLCGETIKRETRRGQQVKQNKANENDEGKALRKIQNNFSPITSSNLPAYQVVIKTALAQGCTSSTAIKKKDLLDALGDDKTLKNALSQCFTDGGQANGHFFDRCGLDNQETVIFPDDVWQALCNINWANQ